MGSSFKPNHHKSSSISQILVHPTFRARHDICDSIDFSTSRHTQFFWIRNCRTSPNGSSSWSSTYWSRRNFTPSSQERLRELQLTPDTQSPLVTRSSLSNPPEHPRRRTKSNMAHLGNIRYIRLRLGLLQNYSSQTVVGLNPKSFKLTSSTFLSQTLSC